MLFAPFLVIAIIDFKDPPLRNIIVVATSVAIILAVYLFPHWLIPKLGNTSLFIDSSQNFEGDAFNKLFSLGYYWFYPIIIGLSATAIYAWEIGHKDHDQRFVITAAMALFVYFAFNVHSVHYASWLVIFPILSLQYHKKVVLPCFVLFAIWIILWLLKTDAGVFTPFLAAPLSADFLGVGHFPSYFNSHLATQSFTLHKAIEITRSLFAVCMAFFCYRLVRTQS